MFLVVKHLMSKKENPGDRSKNTQHGFIFFPGHPSVAEMVQCRPFITTHKVISIVNFDRRGIKARRILPQTISIVPEVLHTRKGYLLLEFLLFDGSFSRQGVFSRKLEAIIQYKRSLERERDGEEAPEKLHTEG